MSNHGTIRKASALTRSGIGAIKQHPTGARQLPAPGTEWVSREQPAELRQALARFLSEGFVESVGYTDRQEKLKRLRTNPRLHESIVAYAETFRVEGPCDHKGVRNLGGGEYTCTNDECEIVFNRATAKRRL